MITADVTTVARWIRGTVHGDGADCRFRGISIDSRKSVDGRLFVALRGENFDGHDHAASAVTQGAVAVVAEQPLEVGAPCIQVSDTRQALGRIGKHWRSRFQIPVIAVTGSNGKTTVKECIAAILRVRGTALATRGNLNNDIGVPLMLCELDTGHQGAVFELGANHPGEIAHLAALVRPDAGVITSIAPAHLEGFGSLEGVARAKGELFAALPHDATAIHAADNEWQVLWREIAPDCRWLTFSADGGAHGDVRVRSINSGRIALCIGDEERITEFGLPGLHNLCNAAAAAAATWSIGMDIDTIAAGLAAVQPVPGRLVRRSGPGGSVILDDSYNANPGSFSAALAVLAEHEGERWAVVGEMAELGEATAIAHRTLGADARRAGIARLWAYGPSAEHTCAGFGPGAEVVRVLEPLADELGAALHAGVALLIKGSRSNGLERLVAPLVDVTPEPVSEGRS